MSSSKLPASNSSLSNFPSIFRTTAWLSSWHSTWGRHLQEYKIPFDQYFYNIPLPIGRFKIVTAIPCGCGSVKLNSIRSEYFQLQQDWDDVSKLLISSDWQQLIVPDIETNTPDFFKLKMFSSNRGYFLLQRSVAIAYGIVTQNQNFSEYLSQLSQSARARIFNKRKKLEQMGKLVIENIWPDVDRFIELLNQFHLQRWGKLCYEGSNLEFVKGFLQAISNEGGKVKLSLMTLDDQVISVLLDVEYQGRVYNFQAGFIEKFSNNIALGSLHLGYEIEAAFSNPLINYYDFMAGQGKNSDYKAAFANNKQELATVYLIKSRWLYWLYRIKDRISS